MIPKLLDEVLEAHGGIDRWRRVRELRLQVRIGGNLLLPGFEFRLGEPWMERAGSPWCSLHVTFPPEIPTHSREQTFYFDSGGLLMRLDYTAEVFGSIARAAHYCHGHREMSGLVMPTHRIVYPRLASGRPLRLFTAMEGWVDDVVVVERGA